MRSGGSPHIQRSIEVGRRQKGIVMAGNRFAPDLRNRKLRNRRPSHATVVAYLALFVALSGTALAVDGPLAGQNTVGSEDIINSEVRTGDIGDAEVSGNDLAPDAVGSGKIVDRQVKNADLDDRRLLLEHDRRWGHPGHRRQGRHPYGRRPRAGPKPDPAAGSRTARARLSGLAPPRRPSSPPSGRTRLASCTWRGRSAAPTTQMRAP